MSITKPISQSGRIYSLFVVIFGIFAFISIGFGVKYFLENTENLYVAILLAVTLFGSYLLPPIFNFNRMNLWKYFTGIIILIFLSPTYINIIIIYSMANLHDVSWGNRATDDNKGETTKRNLEQFRALYLIVWIGLNAVYGYSIIYITNTGQKVYIMILTVLVSANVLLKLTAAMIYVLYEGYTRCTVRIKMQKKKNIVNDVATVNHYGENKKKLDEMNKKRILGEDLNEENSTKKGEKSTKNGDL